MQGMDANGAGRCGAVTGSEVVQVLGAALGYLSGTRTPVLRAAAIGLACGFTSFSFYALQGVTYDGAWNSVVYILVTPVVAVTALAAGALITRPHTRPVEALR
nr:hypothetical protein [uncultured Rhodococcus sp.]